jgi:predicted DNA-binding helix-hairpin-helix protein
MEQVVEVARVLREDHDFRGYIHLKTIPDAAPELLQRAGRYADRLSINIELPTEQGLAALAPEKDGAAIKRSMARLSSSMAAIASSACTTCTTRLSLLLKAPPLMREHRLYQADWLMRFYGFEAR